MSNEVTRQDQEHLKLLSIFHYVVAGLAGLFACFPLLHFFIGLAVVTGTFENSDGEARLVGAFFMVFSAMFILAGWALAISVFIAGRSLAKQVRYTYCLVIAGIECMFMPFGTVLGIFTIIVLMRDSVKPLFERSSVDKTG